MTIKPLCAVLILAMLPSFACKKKDGDKTDSVHIIDARLGTCLHSKLAAAIVPKAGFAKGACPKFIQVAGRNATMATICNSYSVKEDNTESVNTWTIYNKRLDTPSGKEALDVTTDAAEQQCFQLVGTKKP